MAKVTIYTTPTCAYCKMAKEYFKEHNVEYEEKDVTTDNAAKEELMQKSHGMLGVPLIEIGNEVIMGFDKDAIEKALGN